MEIESILQNLKDLLRLEEKTQKERFFDEGKSIKELRKEGIVIHPIRILSKDYGYTDRPQLKVHFNVPEGINASFFSNGIPVSLFISTTGENCPGQILSISEKNAEILLYSVDFPDWIDEKGLGIKRLPDNRSFQAMHGVIKRLADTENRKFRRLFELIHGIKKTEDSKPIIEELKLHHNLNQFQESSIQKGLTELPVQIIHGPPGTGKTTTLVALIQELRIREKTIIAAAPSNAAVDHLASRLIEKGLKIIRLGSTAKVNEQVWQHTPEGILNQEKYSKPLKKLKIKAQEFRKMARQYKRNFGKTEREQRKLLFQEAHKIQDEIDQLTAYFLSNYFENADVILGTPVGITDSLIKDKKFDVAILDEAGQCIEPLAWLLFEKGERLVLGGDHLQLPPTIISDEASKKGLSVSILERAIDSGIEKDLLELQYRMPPEIVGFSSRYFYENKLKSAKSSLKDALIFYDTAGADFHEKKDENGMSIYNPEELRVIQENYKEWIEPYSTSVFISPYAEQVERARDELTEIKISTIDSFQGQEAEIVLLSLVRSNTSGTIGFLSDYRRMNVALTRAQKKLIVFGDSTTLSSDDFYKSFIEYVEEIGGYKSVFELLY